jgi:murein DD-endopeptidase MepM/ murein hydrolase activator NlpD
MIQDQTSIMADQVRFGSSLLALIWAALSCTLLTTGALAQSGNDSATTLQGEIVQGGLIIGKTKPGHLVFIDDEAVMVSSGGDFLIGFGRDAATQAELRTVAADGTASIRPLSVRQREYPTQRIDGLPQEQVTPPPEVLERIRDDGRRVTAARSRRDQRLDFLATFQWPAAGPISGVYGSQRILNGEPRRPHFGVDVAADVGAQVVAPAAGLVTLADPDLYYSGGTLIIDHGHGLTSTFLHLSKLEVEAGQRVEQGQLVARVGATGRVTGPHLDWRMNLRGARLDPQLLVEGLPPGQE